MPQMDWTEPAPPAPPGPHTGDPSPTDPGWREWLDGLKETATAGAAGDHNGPYEVGITVTVDTSYEWRSIEGQDPSPWKKEDVKWTRNDPYEDFTRYKRTYPTVVFAAFTKVTVVVVFRIPGRGVWTNTYEFWYTNGYAVYKHNRTVYRWHKTSGTGTAGGNPGRWEDYTVPHDWNEEKKVRPGDSWGRYPPDRPPSDLLSSIVFPSTGGTQTGFAFFKDDGRLLDSAAKQGVQIAWADRDSFDKALARRSETPIAHAAKLIEIEIDVEPETSPIVILEWLRRHVDVDAPEEGS